MITNENSLGNLDASIEKIGIKFDLNCHVQVKLTDFGRKALIDVCMRDFKPREESILRGRPEKDLLQYIEKEIIEENTKDGYFCCALSDLMNYFGSMCVAGPWEIFENNEIIFLGENMGKKKDGSVGASKTTGKDLEQILG